MTSHTADSARVAIVVDPRRTGRRSASSAPAVRRAAIAGISRCCPTSPGLIAVPSYRPCPHANTSRSEPGGCWPLPLQIPGRGISVGTRCKDR
jgi:hypothetical protein